MNETTPFFESLFFWIPFSFIVGTIFGFIVAAFLASSGQASRDEEWRELLAECEKEKVGKPNLVPITQGTSDRE